MREHICNPSAQRAGAEGYEFKASLTVTRAGEEGMEKEEMLTVGKERRY